MSGSQEGDSFLIAARLLSNNLPHTPFGLLVIYRIFSVTSSIRMADFSRCLRWAIVGSRALFQTPVSKPASVRLPGRVCPVSPEGGKKFASYVCGSSKTKTPDRLASMPSTALERANAADRLPHAPLVSCWNRQHLHPSYSYLTSPRTKSCRLSDTTPYGAGFQNHVAPWPRANAASSYVRSTLKSLPNAARFAPSD